MPIPIIFWAAATAAGAYVAWKNKNEISEFLKKAMQGLSEEIASHMEEGESFTQELMGMDVGEGLHYMKKALPYMASKQRSGVGLNLMALAQKSTKAQQYYDRFTQMKEDGEFFGL